MHPSFLFALIFFCLSTHHFFHGLVPLLLVKILVLKTQLLLAPPIALGAFVIGQGSGLLVGKILGIYFILKKWRGKKYGHHHGQHGYKHHFKSHYVPPQHYNFNKFPPIKFSESQYESYSPPNYVSENSPTYYESPSEHYSDSHSFYNEPSSHGQTYSYSESENIERKYEDVKEEEPKNVNYSSEAEEFIATKMFKDGKLNLDNVENNEILSKLLHEQFKDELDENGDLPPFKPLPIFEKSKNNNTITLKNSTQIANENATEDETTNANENLASLSILNVFKALDPTQIVPESVMSWLFKGEHEKRAKRDVAKKINEKEETEAFVNDVKNLFKIVSFLDIGRCIEKLVCDVNTRADLPSVSSYEGNIITAFKMIELVMPNDKSLDDPSTKYRIAARLGRSLKSSDFCTQTYPSCKMSTSHIISVGNIIAPSIPLPNKKFESITPVQSNENL